MAYLSIISGRLGGGSSALLRRIGRVRARVVAAVVAGVVRRPTPLVAVVRSAPQRPRTFNVGIAVAVALDNGLIVPVVKNVQDMSIAGIQKSVSDVAQRARNKQLLPDEVAGGTFTITNPGQFGGLFGIPIINQPQVAILGIGGIIKRPVVVDGDKIAIRDMLYMCLSYDHRLVDGALADQFMSHVKHTLENFDESAIG